MKSSLFFLSVVSLFFMYSCAPKPEIVETQNVYLTPEIMCGTVQFTDGCGPATDTLIRFGLALIHHMTYEDAHYTFEQVVKKDADCFWGYWGQAMTYIHPLWPDQPSKEEMESGYVLSQKALTLAKSEQQKLYGAALASYYVKEEKTKLERLTAFQQGWAQATSQLPDDPESALFNGLFRLGIVSPADKSFTVQREVGAMAESYLAKYPDHPAAYHYGIHAYDVPPLAPKALELARNYGKIAPEIPHALHMPAHIFTRLGYWDESVDWNARSAKAAARLPFGKEVSPHMFHALDYEVYALLQQAKDAEAMAIHNQIDTITAPIFVNAAAAYGLAAIPVRIPLENRDWKGAASVPLPDTSKFAWKKFPQWEALIHYGRGLGAARNGDVGAAQQSLDRLAGLQKQLGDAPPTKYWYDQMQAQQMSIQAWQMLASGKKTEAVAMMQQAADLEDATVKNPVSPGEILPARELLGDMLMIVGKPKDALVAYEKNLETRPNRFNSLYGAAESAEASGNQAKARTYYTKVVENCGNSTSSRQRLSTAREKLHPS